MSHVEICIGGEGFEVRFRDHLGPDTCAIFRTLLPWRQSIIHARWSGEARWIPLGNLRLKVGCESATSYRQPGAIILYSGGVSEIETMLPRGSVRFGPKAGQLAGSRS